MSEYLDALIRRLEEDAQAQRAHGERFPETRKSDQQRSAKHLSRIQQRIETLRDLRAKETSRRTV